MWQAIPMRLKRAAKTRLTIWLATHRRSSIATAGARAARLYLEMYENHNYEYDSNGESWLLRRIATIKPTCIFDVGANVGDWTADARAAAPKASVHSFELVPETAAKLEARFAGDVQVTANALGLLDEPGTVRVKHYPAFPAVSSISDFPHPLRHEWIEALTTTGDEYCREHGITHVDLLKVDAEGSDHQVIRGFTSMLEQGAVDIVQFEYGRAAIRNHFLLADFYEFFNGVDMQIGKLYPTWVDFRAYDIHRHEDFLGPNFVAVKNSRDDLRMLLADG
jgi:FkbM family methyltransferase